MHKTGSLLLVSLLGLAACGQNDLERGATGAAAGALVAGATSNSLVTGALVGATAGALCDDVAPQLCPY